MDEDPSTEEETSFHRSSTPAVVLRSEPQLRWVDGTGERTAVVVNRTIVGSSPRAGIVVQDPTVSRLHVELDPKEDGLWIRDLGSKNGTFVGSLRVTGAQIPSGGSLRIGAVEVQIDYETAPAKPVQLWEEPTFYGMVGGSVAMRELFARLARVASLNSSILIHGESGTGKELVARALHQASPRANKPFVVVDCAALPENLLETELYGHTRGAFTGAVAARPGAIELADGGTVFLDEIGDLPITMQPKLLRVIESRMIRRVGDPNYKQVDVRFVSATHRDLVTMVSNNEFREDLYFRLSVVPITVPPLRERKEDILLLVKHFLQKAGGSNKLNVELINAIASRAWRGNVRELRNFVERAHALGPQEALAMTSPQGAPSTPNMPAQDQSAPSPSGMTKALEEGDYLQNFRAFREGWIDAGEKEYVRRLLVRHGGNVTSAAREAEIDRTHVYRLIRKHAL